MANYYTKGSKQKAATHERVVLPKPKPRSRKNAAKDDDEHQYAALKTVQRTDDPYEPLRFDQGPQPQGSEATGLHGEAEKGAEREYGNLPRIVQEEKNEIEHSPSIEGEANKEQASMDMKSICCSKWREITFVTLVAVLFILILLVFTIATVGLSRASSTVESEQELQVTAQHLKEQADDMQKEINKTMATLNSALHQISTTTANLYRLMDNLNTLSTSVSANQNDIQTLKADTTGLLATTAGLSSTHQQLLATVESLRDTITDSGMAINSLTLTFQNHASITESNLEDLANSINSLSVQPFANCVQEETLSSITFEFLNNSSATSAVLVSTEPMEISRPGYNTTDIYCETWGNATALNQPLIATLRRTLNEETFCECAMSCFMSDGGKRYQLEETSFVLYCSLTVAYCPLFVPVNRN